MLYPLFFRLSSANPAAPWFVDLAAGLCAGGLRFHERPPRIIGFGVYRSRARVPAGTSRTDGGGRALALLDRLVMEFSSSFEYVEKTPGTLVPRIARESE